MTQSSCTAHEPSLRRYARWLQSSTEDRRPWGSSSESTEPPDLVSETLAATRLALDKMSGVAALEQGHVTSYVRSRAALLVEEVAKFDETIGAPNVGLAPDDSLLLEWWRGPRKLSVYITDDEAPAYIKVWGPDVRSNMSDGAIDGSRVLRSLLVWLRGK